MILSCKETTWPAYTRSLPAPAKFPFNSEGIWLYFVEPDPNLGGRTPDLGQGGALGGGSAINAMIYCRGSASVFDEWAQVSGNDGLAWESMLEAFRATSSWQPETDITYDYGQPINASSFGNGPLDISRQRELFAVDQPLLDTFLAELHVDQIDFVSGEGIGATHGLNSIRASNRTRSYAYNTFGYIANTRSNFKLQTHAWVSTIGFTGTKADRVTYNNTLTNTLHTLHAQEIIVAAGALKSPQLLMLSGVGPAALLAELGIPVVKDVPEIGQNLVDHHTALVEFSSVPTELTLWQYEYNATVQAQANAEYAQDGDGILGKQWGDTMAAVRVPDEVFQGIDGSFFTNLPADRPHVVYEYQNIGVVANEPNISSVTAWAALVQPEATGNVSLATSNYLDAPIIHANYFGSPADQAAMLYGYKQIRAIMNADALKPLLPDELFPGRNITSDDDLWAAIQQTARSWHHPVGTVALGTVLGGDWRVKGLQGLRVVGSASMPSIPTCPIQSSVYAISHRAAVDIAAADRFY